MIQKLRDTKQELEAIPAFPIEHDEFPSGVQRRALLFLLKQRDASGLTSALATRWRNMAPHCDVEASGLLTHRIALAATLSFGVLSACLRTICNSWLTPWRFGGNHKKCPYGCDFTQVIAGAFQARDSQRHLLNCQFVREAIGAGFPSLKYYLDNIGLHALLCLDFPACASDQFVIGIIIVNYMVVSSYNQQRHCYRHDGAR